MQKRRITYSHPQHLENKTFKLQFYINVANDKEITAKYASAYYIKEFCKNNGLSLNYNEDTNINIVDGWENDDDVLNDKTELVYKNYHTILSNFKSLANDEFGFIQDCYTRYIQDMQGLGYINVAKIKGLLRRLDIIYQRWSVLKISKTINQIEYKAEVNNNMLDTFATIILYDKDGNEAIYNPNIEEIKKIVSYNRATNYTNYIAYSNAKREIEECKTFDDIMAIHNKMPTIITEKVFDLTTDALAEVKKPAAKKATVK